MKRKFLLNLLLLIFINVLVKPFYVFVIDVNVQSTVGLVEYGLYLSIFNFSYILGMILDMGTTNFNNRAVARDESFLSRYFSSMVMLRVTLVFVFMILAYSLAFFMDYDGRQLKLLGLIGVNQILSSFVLYLRSNISGMLRFVADSIVSVLDKLILIILCIIIFYTPILNHRFNIEWFIYAQTISYVVTGLVALVIVLRISGKIVSTINVKLLARMLKLCLPYALLSLLMLCYNKIDVVLLKQLIGGEAGNEQVGIYGRSIRILDAMSNFSYLFSTLLLPIYAKMLKNNEKTVPITKTAAGLLVVFSFAVASTSFFYGNDIMQLLYHEHNMAESVSVFKIMMFSLPGISLSYVFGTLLTANGSMKLLNILSLAGVVVNVGLNLLLIPRFGAIGTACTGVFTQLLMVVLQVLFAAKIIESKGEKFPARYMAAITGFIVMVFVVGYFVTMVNASPMVRISLHLTMVLVMAVILKILDIQAALSQIKFRRQP